MGDVRLPGVPFAFAWRHAPAASPKVTDFALVIEAGPETDLFSDPGGRRPVLNAPFASGRTRGEFQFSARVSGELAATFDAGALVLWSSDTAWAKLALEYSPAGEATIVSVVTRQLSDDCNSLAVDGASAWLRISRIAEACAFHASLDGVAWRLIRHFAISGWDPVEVGFLAQSPQGSGCAATFSDVRFRPEALADIRDGI